MRDGWSDAASEGLGPAVVILALFAALSGALVAGTILGLCWWLT